MTARQYIVRILVVAVLFLTGDMAVFHILKTGLDRYYGLNKPARILCVGHSHTVLGIDAERLEKELGVTVAKYATAGANTLDRLWMVRHFLEKQPSVTTVVYDVDPRLFDAERLSSASYTLFLPYINDPAMSEYLWQESTWQEYLASKIIQSARFRDQTINMALRGLLGKPENKKAGRIRIEDYQECLEQEKSRKIRINPESRRCFLKTIELLNRRGITVVLLFIPTMDLLNNIDPIGRDTAIKTFKDLEIINKNIYFIDYNKDYQHRYELFSDLSHLNKEGNEVTTRRLIEDLRYLNRIKTGPASQAKSDTVAGRENQAGQLCGN